MSSRSNHFRLGAALYLGLALTLIVLAVKPQLVSMMDSGETITAEFSSEYKLRPFDSTVKMAGMSVGTVTDVERTDEGTALVTMKIDEGVTDKLGSEPRAEIEPRTLLGGRYAIELFQQGGAGQTFDGHIPLDHTGVPVELDTVLEALPEDARSALQGLVRKAGPTLHESRDELTGLLEGAPNTLGPGADVVSAARGRHPQRDLSELVDHLDTTAYVLTRTDGQLDSIVTDLDTVSAALARHRNDLAVMLDELPITLRESGRGLGGLARSVTELQETATSLRPSAPRLRNLLVELEPTLEVARPVLRDLVATLRQARPAVRELVPLADQATAILRTVRGPVLRRFKGPVMDFLLNPWKGTGYYEDSAQGYQADHLVYEELAYMATNIDRASMGQDQYGSTLAFQSGTGLNSADLGGVPFTVEDIVKLALEQEGLSARSVIDEALRNAGVQ